MRTIIVLTRELHPLKRVRLTELFMKEVSKYYKLIWLLNSKGSSRRIQKGNNDIILIPCLDPTRSVNEIFNIIHRIKKMVFLYRGKVEKMPDILLVNDGLIEGFFGYVYCRYHNIPFSFYLSSIFYNMDRELFKQEKNIINLYKFLISYIKEPLYRYLIRKCDIFHPISNSMGRHFGRIRKNGMTYPLPLCPSNFFLDEGNKKEMAISNNGKIVLIYIGQITAVRKIENLIKLLEIVMERTKNNNIHLHLVGRIYSRKYGEKLRVLSEKEPLKGHVKIMGEKPMQEIPRLIRNASIGLSILPPIEAYRVSSPTKVLEYLSQGIPVICNSEIEDQNRIIVESKGGFSVPYNLEEISLKVMELIEHPEKAYKLGTLGRGWIINNRTYPIIADRMNREYLTYFGWRE